MANKWRKSLAEANAVLERYSVDPDDPSNEMLLRRWDGIDRTWLESARTTIKAATSVTDPLVDGVTFTGTWVMGDTTFQPQNSGNLSGSTSVIQEIKPGYSYCTPDNMTVVKLRAYPVEQNENSWMYYERFKKEETTRWHNIMPSLAVGLFDNLRQIRKYTDFGKAIVEENDSFQYRFNPGLGGGAFLLTMYYQRRHLYDIIFIDPNDDYSGILDPLNIVGNPVTWLGYTSGTYLIPDTANYVEWYDQEADWWYGGVYFHKVSPVEYTTTGWQTYASSWTDLGVPVIRECWIEINKDGSYDLYRTLETTTTTAIKRTRALQYAGLIRVSGLPILDDTTMTLIGFLDTDEWIYENARFRIGSDTYRVLSDAQVSGGAVTVSITPYITQATEDAADEYPEQTQVFFDAL